MLTAKTCTRTGLTFSAPALLLLALLVSNPSLAIAQECTLAGCPSPPSYDSGPISGVINSYYPGREAVVDVGETAVDIGAKATGSAAANLAAGNLAMIIQMQDADINTANTGNYGDNSSGDPARGVTSLNQSGLYEYIRVTSVTGSGSSLVVNFTGISGGGLLNSYRAVAPDSSGTTQSGQRSYQVIRIPEYLNVTIGGTLTAKTWSGPIVNTGTGAGPTGGVLAFDVQNTLTLASQTMNVAGLGFRGGGARVVTGDNGDADNAGTDTDYRTNSQSDMHGSKGEGIVGTPRYVYDAVGAAVVDNTNEGYPGQNDGGGGLDGSSFARGGPGNAGGGGTDGNPGANDQNSGGGGGGNGGTGGTGGNAWSSDDPSGGFGGAAVASTSSRVVMGGGGGAGAVNNGGPDDGAGGNNSCSTCVSNSGGAGGGIVIVRAFRLSGSGTINANGIQGPENAGRDGGGGGGAGGSVVLVTRGGPVNTVTVTANGAAGRNAWPSATGGTCVDTATGNRHGPGGGGGGGAIFTTGPLASSSVTGGANGITTTCNDPYGATAGANGTVTNLAFPTCLPGVPPLWICENVTSVDLASFDAASYDNGVLIRWRTGLEQDNLGFRVYREDGDRRTPITPELIAGSTFGATLRATPGYAYAWWDPEGTPDSRYFLEDVSFTGRGAVYGPVFSSREDGVAPFGTNVRSAMLGEHPEAMDSVSQVDWNFSAEPGQAASAKGGSGGVPGPGGNAQTAQWLLASQPSVKLSISQPGYYRVSQPEFAAFGLDPLRLDPRTIHVYADGVEIPIRVAGEEDGRFDASDAVEFFGNGVDVATTNTRVYWVTAGGSAGLRMKVTPPVRLQPDLSSVSSTVQVKERLVYFAKPNNGEKENWFGRVIASTPVDQVVTLSRLDAANPAARLDVALQGVTSGAHLIDVSVNGVAAGTIAFSDRDYPSTTLTIPAGVLREGANTVTLARSGGPTDISLVDSIRLTYTRSAEAADNELVAGVSGRRGPQTLGGFTSPNVRVIDITNPLSVAEYAGTITGSASNYAVTVPLTGLNRTLYAFTPDKAKHPDAMELNAPSTWNASTNGADLVVISTSQFAPALAPLVAQRKADGYQVAVVDVEDIYDEFLFGYHSPAAIQAFVARARASWRTPPRFVLLAGDASLDPRDYRGIGVTDFVPTKLIETPFAETASDDWLVDTNNDKRPDVAVGRFPVSSVDEVSQLVTKTLGFASTASNRTALVVTDVDDGLNFKDFTSALRSNFPADVVVEEVNRDTLGDPATHAATVDSLNAGRGVVYYAGHGSIDQWRGSVLTSADADALVNAGKPSIVVMSTCLNGYFFEPLLGSLGERLLRSSSGGAVVVIAPSGVSSPYAQHVLSEQLLRELYGTPSVGAGEALRRAKQVGDPDSARTLIFLGDPTVGLR